MIAREDLITQSVQTLVREGLDTLNYTTPKVEILDAFDAVLFEQQYGQSGLNKTYIAVGFQFDDGGREAELGSTLMSYLHTIDFLVFGHTSTWGRNVAHVIKALLNTERGALPLLDYSVATDPRPIIDYMPVVEVSTERERAFDARPWGLHAWTTRLRIVDEYYVTDLV